MNNDMKGAIERRRAGFGRGCALTLAALERAGGTDDALYTASEQFEDIEGNGCCQQLEIVFYNILI